MGWVECSKAEYWEAVNSGDNVVRSEKDHTIWQTRYGLPVARSSVGYSRPAPEEVLYVWRN